MEVKIKDHGIGDGLATIKVWGKFSNTNWRLKKPRFALFDRALPAPVSIVEESIVGQAWAKNMNGDDLCCDSWLVLVFMAIYYSVFGIIADIACLPIGLLVALMF